MTWVRIDDAAPLHPKLIDAGPEAAWLWTCGLAFCNRAHTDGLISRRHLAALYPGAWGAEKLARLAAKLVEVRLWEAAEGGFKVHDYEQFQAEATREAVSIRREYERTRKQAQRKNRLNPAAPSKDSPGSVPDNVPDNVPAIVPACPAGQSHGTPTGQLRGTTVVPVEGTHAPPVPAPRPGPARPGIDEEDARVAPTSSEAPPEPPTKPADALLGDDPLAVLDALSRASGGRIDVVSATLDQQRALVGRLRDLRVTPAELEAIGRLARQPETVWPWAKNLGATVRPRFLLGPGNPASGHEGNALSDLVAAARAAQAPAQRPTAPREAPRPVLAVDRPGMRPEELKRAIDNARANGGPLAKVLNGGARHG